MERKAILRAISVHKRIKTANNGNGVIFWNIYITIKNIVTYILNL